MTFTMIVELLIVLAALYVGSRYGSLAWPSWSSASASNPARRPRT